MDAVNQRFSNNFDLLRMFAAICITFTHSFNLVAQNDREPLMQLSHGRYDFSFIGLCIFFSISGYLIAKSACTSSSILNYCWKRLLRIQPLLILVCLLSIFVLGPLLTILSPAAYFADGSTWTYLRNIFPATGIQFKLPGVFVNNVVESSVNGSLWTLVIEERLYLIVSVLFFLKPSRKWYFIVPLIGLNIFYLVSNYFSHLGVPAYFRSVPVFYALVFLNASAYYLFRLDFKKCGSSYLFLVPPGGMILCLVVPVLHHLSVFFAPLLVISLAHIKGFTNKAGRWGDFTYGIYIFSFPVQQMLIQFSGNEVKPYDLFARTMLVVVPLAVVSWHLFEKKFLGLKSRVK